MARNEPDDLDALLAEVEKSLAPRSGPALAGKASPVRTPSAPPARASAPDDTEKAGLVAWLTQRVTVALVCGGVSAALVFLLFFFTPLTGAISGALGAAIAGFLTGLLLPRRL